MTGLVQIADTGLSPDAAPTRMAMRAAAVSVADEVFFDVQPVPQTVQAAVEVRFTCGQPEL